jgi:redox-sensitive bicupin YhaK (pirin superfamily)
MNDMLKLRPGHELQKAERSWLKARYHFIVSPEGNPEHTPLGPLIVWNDDEIAPGTGFGLHSHSDLEIITYVREGAVTHEDDRGNHGVTRAGEVQVMSAGTGITHSERNTGAEVLRLFQIWLLPRKAGNAPRWESRAFPNKEGAGRLITLASGLPEDDGALTIDADARVIGALLLAGTSIVHAVDPGSRIYLAPSKGAVRVNGLLVASGDGLAIEDEGSVTISADEEAEIVMVEAR